jgi:hypothetical protein
MPPRAASRVRIASTRICWDNSRANVRAHRNRPCGANGWRKTPPKSRAKQGWLRTPWRGHAPNLIAAWWHWMRSIRGAQDSKPSARSGARRCRRRVHAVSRRSSSAVTC